METRIKKLRTWLRDAAWRWRNDSLNSQPNDYRSFFNYYWNWFDESDGIKLRHVEYAWNHPKQHPNPLELLR